MARRRQRKKTHSYTLEDAQSSYIAQIAERYDFNSDSKALRRILEDHQARTNGSFLSDDDRFDDHFSKEIETA